MYAKVGLTETTSKIQKYELAENPLIHLYDLPGAGMENFPISSYPKTVKMDNYDVFILLARGRFQENDKIILNEIEKRRKPCYFARTHTDVDLQEFAYDNPEDFSKGSVKILDFLYIFTTVWKKQNFYPTMILR